MSMLSQFIWGGLFLWIIKKKSHLMTLQNIQTFQRQQYPDPLTIPILLL